MPTQQDIRNYLVDNNVESTSTVNLVDSIYAESVRQAIDQIVEESRRMQEYVAETRREQTEMLDQTRLERDDLKTRLIAAERNFAAAMDEVVAMRGEINELKEALNQRQVPAMRDHGNEDDDMDNAGDRSGGDGVNQEVHGGILPENVTPEVLSAIVTNHQRDEDCYWRSSLMITVGSGEFGDFRSWRHKLYCMGLHFLYHESVSHYVTGRGNLRLTYRSEYEMRKKIIEARKFCKERHLRSIKIELMVPPRFVQEKKKMMRKGRQMKANGLIGVYDVLIKWGQPVLRTFSQAQGVRFLKANEIPEQNETPIEV